MNNRYFATLLCITVLALVPACYKQSCKIAQEKTNQENINTMIDVEDSEVVESEDDLLTSKS
jgi:hypothetical protein